MPSQLYMLSKGCYHVSIILAFSCRRAKTIEIRYVWTGIFFVNEEKDLHIKIYSDTCGQGISYSRNPNILQNTKVPFSLVVVGFLEPVKACINYSRISPRWPPWGQKKVTVMGRKGCNLTNVFRGVKHVYCAKFMPIVFHNGYPSIK